MLKRFWKLSILRFYWLNTTWNIGFWMNSKPFYEQKHYSHIDEKLDLDKNLDNVNLQFQFDTKRSTYNRLKGYWYKGGIYMDNPGPQCSVDAETRAHWLKRRWI